MQSTDAEKHKILYLSFNQDSSCFCTGTEDGFAIYSINPFQEIYQRSKKTINQKKFKLYILYRSWRRNWKNRDVKNHKYFSISGWREKT